MAACTSPTFQNDQFCPSAEYLSAAARVWYANKDDWETAVLAGEIASTDNVITTFAPTTPILYPLWAGKKFDIAPDSTNIKTDAGSDKWSHSFTAQLISANAADDLEISKWIGAEIVVIYEVLGANAANEVDSFKVLGEESGLTSADGSIVLTGNANGGAAVAAMATDPEDGATEPYSRLTLKPTAATDKAAVVAAILLAEVPAS